MDNMSKFIVRVRKAHAKLYIKILNELMDQIKILNPKPDYKIIPEEIPKYSIKPENALNYFIEKLEHKEYETLLNRFNDIEFRNIFNKLFNLIENKVGVLELHSNSFTIIIGVEKIFEIIPIFKIRDKYKHSWKETLMSEKVGIFIQDLKNKAKHIYEIDLK